MGCIIKSERIKHLVRDLKMAQKRLAVLVGCNYENYTDCALRGSINNVEAWRDMLKQPRFGFKHDDITLLIESSVATHDNIMAKLNKMVEEAGEGDVLFFHFSGHGILLPSDQIHQSDPGLIAIVPSDLKLITDMDLRNVVDGIPMGASFTVLADCSHSGGLIQGEKQQIPIPDKLVPIDPYKPDAGILLSACEADGNSYEIGVLVPGKGRVTYGVFTNTVMDVLEGLRGPISNQNLVLLATAKIKNQQPCLYCSDANAQASFLQAQPE